MAPSRERRGHLLASREGRELVLDCYSLLLAESSARWPSASSTSAGSTRPCGPASAAAPSAPTRSPRCTPTCCSTSPSRRRDVLTLAHELGHGVHAALAARQGIFHQGTPLTLAETASVFGETAHLRPPARGLADARRAPGAARRGHRGHDRDRLPPGRDEPLRGARPHRAARAGRAVGRALRRAVGADPGRAARRRGRGHRRLPLVVVLRPALHRHARLRLRLRLRPAARAVGLRALRGRAPGFEQRYLELLAAGGSRSPEELGEIVGIDLADPGFWDAGSTWSSASCRRPKRRRPAGRRDGCTAGKLRTARRARRPRGRRG